MHKHTKAQLLASTSPSPPADISSSPPTSPVVKPSTTKPEPFDSGNLHIPPPTATSASTTTTAATTGASPETNAGITATTIITTTAYDQANPDAQQRGVHSSIHSRRASAANSALYHSPGFSPPPASAPLTTRHSPSPSSSPTAQPLAAHFDAAATIFTSSMAKSGAMADTHRRRSSAGLRKLSAGLAKLGLWRSGQHAADHNQHEQQNHNHHHHHSQSDQHQSQGPDEWQERRWQAAESEVEHGVPAMAQLQCECGACDWCRLRSEGLKRNGLCNVGVGGPGLMGVAVGRRDTV